MVAAGPRIALAMSVPSARLELVRYGTRYAVRGTTKAAVPRKHILMLGRFPAK